MNQFRKTVLRTISLTVPQRLFPLNIAEGNGKFTQADRCKYFDNSRGSALECAAALDVLVAKRLLESGRAAEGKALLVEIVSMLVGLIKANSDNRKH